MEPHSNADETGATPPARISPISKIMFGWIGSALIAAIVASVLILNGHKDIGVWITPVVVVIGSVVVRYLLSRYTVAQKAAGEDGGGAG
jgi:uncharacterized membrane protein YeaQ/YmgE (transglycosylase-associated protein family)